MTTIAIPDTRPTIVCPDWCAVGYEGHLEDLPQMDGFVVHWSSFGVPVYLGCGAFPDGTPAPDDPPLIHIENLLGDGLTIDDAEDIARQLLAAVEVARS